MIYNCYNSHNTVRYALTGILLIITSSISAQVWPVVNQEAKPGVRWWWPGSAVDNENLKWNLEEYANKGIGTVEITPIYGVQGNEANDISFLSPAWMNVLSTVMTVCSRDSIEVDMDTGTGWPFGGPEVPINEGACKVLLQEYDANGKYIRQNVEVNDAKEKQYAYLSRVMAYPTDGSKAIDVTRYVKGDSILEWKTPAGSWHIYALYVSRTRGLVERAAPGGEGYVIDHFDRVAVQHYLQRFDRAFAKGGSYFPHTFFNDSYEVERANWTPTLLEEFQKRRGYKLEEHIPELLGTINDNNQTLSDYRETLSDLLIENFTTQWTEWAHSHGSITRNQAHGSPSNLIDTYAAVDIPEIEGFGLTEFHIKGLRTDSGFTRTNFSDLSMLKYASSAAHITGKKFTSSETFTWLTEHFRTSMSQCKPDLDLMFVSGVNHMLFHGTCYSPKNDPWPGWKFYASIDMSPTNTIWRDADYFMQYITRCQSFLQWGQPDNDFIVYLPIRSMWHQRLSKGLNGIEMLFDINSMKRKSPHFIRTILNIDSLGYDCDYISDKYLLTTSYAGGMICTAAGTRYKALLLPDSSFIPKNVIQHLNTLSAQGANIIYGWNPEAMNRVASPEPMKTDFKLKTIRRRNNQGYHYFISNLTPNDIDKFIPLSIKFRNAMLFDPMTGDKRPALIQNDKIEISLRSGQSVILETFDNDIDLGKAYPALKMINPKVINNGWKLSFTDGAPKVDGIFNIGKLKSWENINNQTRVTMGTGTYTSEFYISKAEIKSCKSYAIDLGDVRESARVWINGKYIGCAWCVPYILNCKNALKEGMNTIRIDVTNLAANRIAEMDREGIQWRKFKEINFVDFHYKKTTYGNWAPVPSGLNSEVVLYQLK